MTMKPEAILLIPLALYGALGVAALFVGAGVAGYDKLVENRNTVTLNVHAKTQDGYQVDVQAKARAYGSDNSDFATDAEKAYKRTISETEMRSAMGLVVLQDVANDACQFNNNNLSGTFLQEVNGASFSHLVNRGSFMGVRTISIPKQEQSQLISHCKPAVAPPT